MKWPKLNGCRKGSQLPAGPKFVLVEYGSENGLQGMGAALTISVDRNLAHNLLGALSKP